MKCNYKKHRDQRPKKSPGCYVLPSTPQGLCTALLVPNKLFLSWYLHQPESHQISLKKMLYWLTHSVTSGPIDRTPGLPGSDKKVGQSTTPTPHPQNVSATATVQRRQQASQANMSPVINQYCFKIHLGNIFLKIWRQPKTRSGPGWQIATKAFPGRKFLPIPTTFSPPWEPI